MRGKRACAPARLRDVRGGLTLAASFEILEASMGSLGRFGSPMSDPSNPRMGFLPFKDRGFETFIRRDLIVRVRFLASLTFFRLVKTKPAAEK